MDNLIVFDSQKQFFECIKNALVSLENVRVYVILYNILY